MKGINRSSKAKILLHIRSLDIGGSERQVGSLAKSMADLGAEIHIAVIKSGGQLETDILGIPNIHLHYIGESGLGGRLKYLLRLRSLINSIEFNGSTSTWNARSRAYVFWNRLAESESARITARMKPIVTASLC